MGPDDYSAGPRALLETQAKCREWREILCRNGWESDKAGAARAPEARAAELAVMGLIKRHRALLEDCERTFGRDPSTALRRALDYIDIYLSRGPEALEKTVGLAECLTVEVAQPNVAEPYREPTFVVQLGRWAEKLAERAGAEGGRDGEGGAGRPECTVAPTGAPERPTPAGATTAVSPRQDPAGIVESFISCLLELYSYSTDPALPDCKDMPPLTPKEEQEQEEVWKLIHDMSGQLAAEAEGLGIDSSVLHRFVLQNAVYGTDGMAMYADITAFAERVRAAQRAKAGAATAAKSEGEESLRRTLALVMPKVEFSGMAFADVVQFLHDASCCNIYVNWPALASAGIDERSPVNVSLGNVTLGKVLEYVLRDVGGVTPLAAVLDEGIIRITTMDDAQAGRGSLILDGAPEPDEPHLLTNEEFAQVFGPIATETHGLLEGPEVRARFLAHRQRQPARRDWAFPPREPVSLTEKYIWLGTVHDLCCCPNEPVFPADAIDPLHPAAARLGLWGRGRAQAVQNVQVLVDFLAEVRADLAAQSNQEELPGGGKEVGQAERSVERTNQGWRRKKVKEPTAFELAVAKEYERSGDKQKAVADRINEQIKAKDKEWGGLLELSRKPGGGFRGFGPPLRQEKVSDILRKVNAWREANGEPVIPTRKRGAADTMAPADLELGPRDHTGLGRRQEGQRMREAGEDPSGES